ncbi:MAG: cation transporter [Bacteroidetes bacterium]|nr:cation transporter [Bacteroidota bacterium]
MFESHYQIPKMDCPSEENLIRMKLDSLKNIHDLKFDLKNRQLFVYHDLETMPISQALESLDLGSKLLGTTKSDFKPSSKSKGQRSLLIKVLIINAAFFAIELGMGLFAKSLGLIADSLDMLADALVYGLSLWAVSGDYLRKKMVSKWAGYLQIGLAILGFAAVLKRFLFGNDLPQFESMIIISILALIANAWCLVLLQRSKSKEEAHMQASMIFTSNDIIINAGVILAGILVFIFQSPLPDLLIGSLVFALVIKGARRILKLA